MILPVGSATGHLLTESTNSTFSLVDWYRQTHMESSVVFFCQSVVQKNGLGMSDVQISVWLRRVNGAHMIVNAFCKVFVSFLFNEIFETASIFINSSSCTNILPLSYHKTAFPTRYTQHFLYFARQRGILTKF